MNLTCWGQCRHNSGLRASRRRCGVLLITVLATLGIVLSLMASAVTISLRQRREVRNQIQVEQTRWLLDAAISHAVTKARSTPDYQGETLAIRPPLGLFIDSWVEIKSDPEPTESDSLSLHVAAWQVHRDRGGTKTKRSQHLKIILNVAGSK